MIGGSLDAARRVFVENKVKEVLNSQPGLT
jgi:hypothetical protein